MTPEMNWQDFDIDHVRPVYSFDVSVDEQLKEDFVGKKLKLY